MAVQVYQLLWTQFIGQFLAEAQLLTRHDVGVECLQQWHWYYYSGLKQHTIVSGDFKHMHWIKSGPLHKTI